MVCTVHLTSNKVIFVLYISPITFYNSSNCSISSATTYIIQNRTMTKKIFKCLADAILSAQSFFFTLAWNKLCMCDLLQHTYTINFSTLGVEKGGVFKVFYCFVKPPQQRLFASFSLLDRKSLGIFLNLSFQLT